MIHPSVYLLCSDLLTFLCDIYTWWLSVSFGHILSCFFSPLNLCLCCSHCLERLFLSPHPWLTLLRCYSLLTVNHLSSYQSYLVTFLWNLMVSRSLKYFSSWDCSIISECHSENVVHISVYSFGHFWPEQYFRLPFLCPVALTWWPGHIHVSP